MAEWTQIHDFVYGWGMHTYDSEEVHEETDEDGFKTRTVSRKGSKFLSASGVKHYLNRDLFSIPKEELDSVWEDVRKAGAAYTDGLKLKEVHPRFTDPPVFESLVVPTFKKEVVYPDIRQILTDSLIKEHEKEEGYDSDH